MLHQNTFLLIAVLVIAIFSTIEQNVNASVVASLKPIGFIVSAVADGVTNTEVLLPEGASEHNYSLCPSDIKRIKKADLVVWIGPKMEIFMTKLMKQLTTKKQVTIAELNQIQSLLIKYGRDCLTHDHNNYAPRKNSLNLQQEEYNMHLWLSPKIAWLSAVEIHDRLVALMPKSQAKLDSNLKAFKIKLAETDKKISIELAPLKEKGYFVFHDAYSYYEKYYGLTPLGYFTINPEIQPGAQRLHQIRRRLVEKKEICVFSEPQFKPVFIEAVARGTSVHMGILDPLGINIPLNKHSYATFLNQLTKQYVTCLKGE